jgi:RimJ/RimL family protein N-acetyltransferase
MSTSSRCCQRLPDFQRCGGCTFPAVRTIIGTQRMSLVALTADALDELLVGAAVVAGVAIPSSWPNAEPDQASLVRHFSAQLRDEPSLFQWRFRLMADRTTGAMIGHCGFHDPPQSGLLELGYTVLERHRRQGYATEAICALMNEAASEHGIHRFRLAISPTNVASTSLALHLGFDCVGEQIDPDDGLELLYERHWLSTAS